MTENRQVNMSIHPAVYPPVEVSHGERRKGVFPHVINKPADLVRAATELTSFGFGENVTRNSVLYAVTETAFAGLTDEDRQTITPVFETAIPLADTGVVGADYIVYMGHNHPDRQSRPEVIEEQLGKVETIFTTERIPHQHKEAEGVDIRILSHDDRQAIETQEQLTYLYTNVFGYSIDEVAGMLNSDNLIAVAVDTKGTLPNSEPNRIVSAGVVEFSNLSFDSDEGPVVISRAELTDGVTVSGLGGYGLYTKTSNALFKALAEFAERGDVHLAFTESNLERPAVFGVGHEQRRKLPPKEIHGLKTGPLVQTCEIPGGKNGHGEVYNNLLPMYFSRADLLELTQNGHFD